MGLVDLLASIDARVWMPPEIPKELDKELRAEFTHSNPDFHKARKMGFSVWGKSSTVETWRREKGRLGECLTLPRGGIGRIKNICSERGFELKWQDRRTVAPVEFPPFVVDPDRPDVDLRWYQHEAIEECVRRGQGVVRAPTGSGKTASAMALLSRLGQRALVIMRDGNLMRQWQTELVRCLGLSRYEIGVVGGGKFQPGPRVTLALQQTLYSRRGHVLDKLLRDDPYGVALFDEIQFAAAATVNHVLDRLPAKYRFGVSADERRRDRKEFLTHDVVGPVIHEVSRKQLEEEKVVHPVTVRLVPTNFEAPWYSTAEDASERDFKRLIDEMVEDEGRNAVLLRTIVEAVKAGEFPMLVFCHRREHAHLLDQALHMGPGIRCGLLLGGDEDRQRFAWDKDLLNAGKIPVACGTYQSIGVGLNLPTVEAGVMATPSSMGNPQFFNQVRGRICRISSKRAILYVLVDWRVFPKTVARLMDWSDSVEYRRRGDWVKAVRATDVFESGDDWRRE